MSVKVRNIESKPSVIDLKTGEMGIEGTKNLRVKLARTPAEVKAIQKLRFDIFYTEMGAKASEETLRTGLDKDKYDDVCDHLMVLDITKEGLENQVVGTYRMTRREAAEKVGGFYSAQEFDLRKLDEFNGVLVELGRSAVHPDYRNRPTMQLLWRGLAAYLVEYNIDMMFGCASLPGTNIQAIKLPLSYLYHYHLAPPAFRVRALPEVYQEINLMPQDIIDVKAAIQALPPLLKGYLRVGSRIGEGAYIDHAFNTTDVFIMINTEDITDRYADKYLSRYETPLE